MVAGLWAQSKARGVQVEKLDNQDAVEAAVFRRLLQHLDEHRQVQNIDLMNLAGFCRNCLAKWYVAAAAEQGQMIDYESARERVYGMPYDDWKKQHQTAATQDQLATFAKNHPKHS